MERAGRANLHPVLGGIVYRLGCSVEMVTAFLLRKTIFEDS